jgi:uncharacterized membrane protein YdbT with pleckstrin-like domain
MKQLDPKAIWLFFINNSLVTFVLGGSLGFMLIPIFIASQLATTQGGGTGFIVGLLLCCVIFFAVLGFSYFWSVLTYNNFKYELTEDAFKKEQGVIFKKYISIPYERIQNVDIYRGLIARFLGLSDLQIQTAGYSMANAYGMSTEGRLPALDKDVAEELRQELVKRAKAQK